MASNADNLHEMISSNHGQQLSENKLSVLTHFMDISGISDDVIAKNILESNNWDLERAVDNFMGYNDPSLQNVRRRNAEIPTVDISPFNQRRYRVRSRNVPWYKQFTSFLISPVRWTLRTALNMIHIFGLARSSSMYVFTSINFYFGAYIVYFMSTFFYLMVAITDPAGDVRNFIESFEKKYVSALNEDQTGVGLVPPRMPPFFNGTYADALKEAKQTLRFLIVYLHGDSHEHTDVFCRDTLLDPVFLDFLTDNSLNVLLWGCNLNSPEGYRVSETFREHTYPFVGVVGLSNNPIADGFDFVAYSSTSFGSPTRMALLGRIEGLTPTTELITQLNLIMDDHQGVIVAERADRAERELSSRLRREQDEAFQASLEMDRARARLRAAAAETEARLAREAAEARKREALLARANVRRQRRWAASLPQEPSGDLDTVRHSIKLPNGTRAQRVFSVTDSLKVFNRKIPVLFSLSYQK
ncbi:unnamed protein product [Rodentolepis nana]|uniref:UAS domain-containing protein n=1 Tax=Rodentolepis nana TaxID=102285 RepID=A0A0R3T8N4_RODNA|nr:unnamed protein product [Rodentolepis nana]